MRFVYLGPPDEPEVGETSAFGLMWVTGQLMDVGDSGAVARLRRHPHFAAEDEAHGFEAPPDGDVQEEPVRRRPGRPRKSAD